MKKLKLIIMLIILVVASTTFSNIKKIEYFDGKFYHPEESGLRDLVFKVRISNLIKSLNEQKIYGKVKDVYFQVFWIYSGKVKIDIYGLPKGFRERKEMLRQMIRTRLDFVIPQKIAPQLKGYQFTSKIDQKLIIYKGIDNTGKKPQHEVEVVFDNKGRLLKLKSMGTLGVSEIESSLGKRSWSKGAWVLDELITKMTNMNNVTTIMEHEFNYLEESGFGFPVKIKIDTSYEAPGIKGKTKKVTNTMTFFGYQVNTGRAKKVIKKAEKSVLQIQKNK